jgi:hypothetical protein
MKVIMSVPDEGYLISTFLFCLFVAFDPILGVSCANKELLLYVSRIYLGEVHHKLHGVEYRDDKICLSREFLEDNLNSQVF